MPKQRMTVEQYVEITDWLKNNKNRIERLNECTQLEAAAIAEAELGYAVPLTTIQRCAKIAKVKWAKSPAPPPPVPIERDAIIILIGAISGLYVETGRTLPAELANLQSTYVREAGKDSSNNQSFNHTFLPASFEGGESR